MKKKIILLSFVFILAFIFIPNVEASKTYTRGIVTKNSRIFNSSGSQLKSDTGGNITLSSPEAVEILGEESSNYRIKFMYTGFIYEGYIAKNAVTTKTYTTDDSYEQNLINMGFPSSYASKLAIIHAIHPNWIFTPSKTGNQSEGIDFYSAVNGEASVVARNVIQTSNNSLKSTADGAYQNGVWINLAGNNWHAASVQTIAFYMDPRNFLDESHIFMFENLGYNPSTTNQDKEVVNKILNPTFMKNPFDCYEVSNMCTPGVHSFTDSFMSVGSERKVSPVHLATRVVQEQGTNGSVLSLGRGYNSQYIGYYNFFNVAASGKNDEEVILNGLAYAAAQNWNNQYASIYGGSSLISNNYIGRGQSTRYYQKINTIASPYYGNQYMQNIRAPYSEAYSTYTSYYKASSSMDEWDKEYHDFLIPVYSNLPEFTTLDASQNGDATLKSLNVDKCKLNPSFQSSAYYYTCNIPSTEEQLNITAESTNPNAKVENPGNVTIESNEQEIKIKVIAVNGSESIYIINVKRQVADNTPPVEILNSIGIKVSDNFASNIPVGSDISNIINSVNNKYFFATIKLSDLHGQEIFDGISKTGDTINIVNGSANENFKIVIYGDVTGDGQIDIRDLLGIQKHLVKSKTVDGEFYKAADINKDGTVDIRDLLLAQKYLVGAYTISQE